MCDAQDALLDLLVFCDVGRHRETAQGLPLVSCMRQQLDLEMANLTVFELARPLVGDRMPACAGGWWPDPIDWRLFNPFLALSEANLGAAAREALSMVHRYGAALVAAILCVLGVKAVRRGARTAARGWLLLGLLGLQLLLGAGMVLANFPLTLALLHNLGAALLRGANAGLSCENVETKEEA